MKNPKQVKDLTEKESRNFRTAYNFYCFCRCNPELRFWQALYEWSRKMLILVDGEDPFYWEGKDNKEDHYEKNIQQERLPHIHNKKNVCQGT